MNGQILPMAFAMYNSPGVYALLLGSGVSKAAEIPTGWDIVKDLIRQIAVASGETPPQKPDEWYIQRYGQEPRYDDLLQRLGTRRSERNAILRPYFEASEQDRQGNPDAKQPTRAHRAIAQLIKGGYIRVVLTTNFDRLLENALEEIGIVPDVVSTDSALRGALFPHSPITIYKLHGDYRDVGFKNIASELDHYTKPWNAFLDRVLDEYGLIVCGWSADWDVALRTAIERAKSRRYTTFWSVYSDPTEITQELIKRRDAQQIGPISADDLFVELQQSVEALQSLNRAHPLSVGIAVERTKRLIPSESTQIELEELFRSEVERAYGTFISPEFGYRVGELLIRPSVKPIEKWNEMLSLYFNVCEISLNMAATLAWYGKPHQASHIRYAVRRWIETPEGQIRGTQWQYLPSLLLIYIAGIATVYKSNWPYLPAIFCDDRVSHISETGTRTGTVMEVIIDETVGRFAEEFPERRWRHEPIGKLIYELIRPVFVSFIPSSKAYEAIFDLFEALLAVFFLYIDKRPRTPRLIPQAAISGFGSPRSLDYILEFWSDGGRQGVKWGLLQAGLFESDPEVLKTALTLHQARMANATDPQGFSLHVPGHYIDAYNQAGK
ncbi:MAG: SIR2 family protein [Anaerolineaceae bacterium]